MPLTTANEIDAALTDMLATEQFARVKIEYRRLVSIPGPHDLAAITDSAEGDDVLALVCLAVKSCHEQKITELLAKPLELLAKPVE
jgi:hypothetical protein